MTRRLDHDFLSAMRGWHFWRTMTAALACTKFGYRMDSGPLVGLGVSHGGPSVVSGEAAPANP
ncbi:MAG: hypothetical protein NTV93_18460 [Verrucomicrobia bacterium]|nr:hypothetical protein [Verrucomicrobiota bacterium]